MHPEDKIHKVKSFINELQLVQEKYLESLVKDLNFNDQGEEWLFDYIFNSNEKEYDGFDHYLSEFKKTYAEMINNADYPHNPCVNLLSSDFEINNPMLHMTSLEPDLDSFFLPDERESKRKEDSII